MRPRNRVESTGMTIIIIITPLATRHLFNIILPGHHHFVCLTHHHHVGSVSPRVAVPPIHLIHLPSNKCGHCRLITCSLNFKDRSGESNKIKRLWTCASPSPCTSPLLQATTLLTPSHAISLVIEPCHGPFK